MTDNEIRGSSGERALKIGLIGAGKMGVNHLRGIAGCTGVQVVGICDPRANLEELRPMAPQALLTRDLDELFEKARPDIVHIVTPPATHGALARRALEAGTHIYVEKPFTLELAEAREIMELARQRNLSVCAGHQCLMQHSAKLARTKLPMLSNIVHVESYFSFHTSRRSIDPIDQAKDILPHAVYMLVDVLRLARPGAGSIRLCGADVSADGGIYAVVELEGCRGILIVTLAGRPVEQYVNVVGTRGNMRIDLVSDAVTHLFGPGVSGVAALTHPYRTAWQYAVRSTKGFARRIRNRKYGYAGLKELAQQFYDSVRRQQAPPIAPQSILDTVELCEQLGTLLDAARAESEAKAQQQLIERERAVAPPDPSRGPVVVTGASGFLGRTVVRELRNAGWPVRALSRQLPRYSSREPGVEYFACELTAGIPTEILTGASAVVHCAAETRGGKTEHERNSIDATSAVLKAMREANVNRLVHISSVAVMTPGSGPMNESTPVDYDSLERGPYAWGKARSEKLVLEANGVDSRILRFGPLVDFDEFDPPGRLGREVGPIYVAIGPKKQRISLCNVKTAAAVIRGYLEHFDNAPPVLNLLEPNAPTRRELVDMLRRQRPDLSVFWFPWWLLRSLSAFAVLLQKLAFRPNALDIASAFTSPRYRTDLAEKVIRDVCGTQAPKAR